MQIGSTVYRAIIRRSPTNRNVIKGTDIQEGKVISVDGDKICVQVGWFLFADLIIGDKNQWRLTRLEAVHNPVES